MKIEGESKALKFIVEIQQYIEKCKHYRLGFVIKVKYKQKG